MTRGAEILVFGVIAVALHAAAAPQLAGRVVPGAEIPRNSVLTIAAPPPAVSRQVSDWERRPSARTVLRTPRSPAAARSPGSVASVAKPRRVRRLQAVATPRMEVPVAAAVALAPPFPAPAAAPPPLGLSPSQGVVGVRPLMQVDPVSTGVTPRRPVAVPGFDGGPLFHVVVPPAPARPREGGAHRPD